jgi:hypothetical protein
MLLIMRKYSSYFLISLFVFFLLSAMVIMLIHGDIQKVVFAGLICGLFIYFNTLGPVFGSEQYEEKHKGYEFLNILPLREMDIVGAKFIWVLLIDAFFAGGILIFLRFAPWTGKQLVLFRSLALLNVSVSLLLVALSYLFIFWIGYTKYMIVVLSVMVAMGFIPMIVLKFFRDRIDQIIANIGNFMIDINWLMVLPIVLMVYFGLLFLAIKVKKY